MTHPLRFLVRCCLLGGIALLSACQPSVPEVIKIGVAQPLSGPLKALGEFPVSVAVHGDVVVEVTVHVVPQAD